MSGLRDEVIKIFYMIRKFLGIVQYDSTTGLNVAGTLVGYETVTFAQFIDSGFNLDDARHVRVSDRHSTRDASDECGSLWWIAPANATGYKQVLISPPIYCATSAALPSASTFKNGRAYQADLGPEGCDMLSDGTGWVPVSGSVIHRDSARSTMFVCPTSTFGTANVDNDGSGYARLTGAGAHGLTNAVCISPGKASIWITGGTAGLTTGFHQIRSFTDGTSVLVLETAYSSTGTATCRLNNAGTDITLETVTLPRLAANSKITVNATTLHTNTANNKNFKIKLGGTNLVAATFASLGASSGNKFSIYNRSSVSSQVSGAGSAQPTGLGGSSTSPATSSIDTSTGSAQLTFTYAPEASNEVCGFEAYEVVVS